MPPVASLVEVYVEIGKTRTFAITRDWPGWCRGGRDETHALQALLDYGPRYAHVLQGTPLEFRAPSAISDLLVVARLPGNTTTDFGAPDADLATDALPVDTAELQRMQTMLKACWETFDSAVQSAEMKVLRKGPRGGGRDLMKIREHVRDAEIAYLNALGGKPEPGLAHETGQILAAHRQAILAALALAARGEIPAHGPRGGIRWTPRFFVRRLVWHALDHAWEIEDRAE